MIENISTEALSGAGAGAGTVALAWVTQQLIAALKGKRDDDKEDKSVCYRPDETWKQYCTAEFSMINVKLNQLFTKMEFMQDKFTQFQIESVKRAR